MDQDELTELLTYTADDAQAFARASTMIEQQGLDGNGAASALLATLEATGAGRHQNWQRAFDFLLRAAEQGFEPAQTQLRLLARRTGDDWPSLRASIDVDALLAAPERESLCDSPRIRTARAFATPDECAWMIAAARERLVPAEVWHPDAGAQFNENERSNSTAEFRLFDLDVMVQVVRARIATITKLPVLVFEVPQVLRYRPGESFKPHHDYFDPAKPGNREHLAEYGQRIATFLIYLNDAFEGGETSFPELGLSFRGSTGDAIFFANVDGTNAPDPKSLHAGMPPTSGEKWLFSQWIHDRSRVRG